MSRRPKILVVGSFVMDQIATTEVIPREGQTVLGKTFSKAPGGKGANQAVQAARLGADVTMVGKLGHDANGEEMLNVCREAGIDISHIAYDEHVASGCSMIMLQEKPGEAVQNRILVIPGTNMTITEDDILFLKEEVKNYDMVILQLEIPMNINVAVAKYAYDAGVPVLLNSAPSAPLPEDLLSHLTYLSPNETELEDITGVHIRHREDGIVIEDVKKAAGMLKDRGVQNLLVTLGSAGALLLNEDGEFYAPCATNVTVVDPTAAGDSFIGAFSTGVCCGWDMETILTFANHTAAITVSHMGAMPSLPMLEMVEEGMKARDLPVPDTGILKEKR